MRAVQPPPQPDDFIELDDVHFTFTDIHSVVDTFYGRVAVDPLLKVPFSTVKDWPHHVVRMTHFWWIRLGGRPYLPGMYNPVEKHFIAGFNPMLLRRWLAIFRKTIEETLTPEKGAMWIEISEHMGAALSMKNDAYKEIMAKQKG